MSVREKILGIDRYPRKRKKVETNKNLKEEREGAKNLLLFLYY